MSRYRIEVTLAALLSVLTVSTALWPVWLESLVGLSPDAGDGSTEWWLVAVLAVSAALAALAARRDARAHRPGLSA